MSYWRRLFEKHVTDNTNSSYPRGKASKQISNAAKVISGGCAASPRSGDMEIGTFPTMLDCSTIAI